jgi:hypothetical protein
VQRIEADGVASLHSREAIAGALGVSPAQIAAGSEPRNSDAPGHADGAGKLARRIHVRSPSAYWLLQLVRSLSITLLGLMMAVLLASGFIMAFGGVFFWELTDMSRSQSAGIGILNGLLMLLLFFAVRKLYHGIKGIKISNRELGAAVSD